MLNKEEVLRTIENIIKEPVRRNGGLSKEIRILKAVEEMSEHRDDVIICEECNYFSNGLCTFHRTYVYSDDYCSFAIKKEEKE